MSSLKDAVIDAKIEDLHKIVNSLSAEKFLCYTKFQNESDALVLGVSDGIDVWHIVLDKAELEEMRDLANISRLDAYLAKIRFVFCVWSNRHDRPLLPNKRKESQSTINTPTFMT
jgi:hypothetical protein